MASLKDIKRKIAAVKQTKQITRAMNMVSAAKLRSTQTKMERFRPYSRKYQDVIADLAGLVTTESSHPYLVQKSAEEVKKIELIAFASDRGLCGGFNANTITRVEKFIRQAEAKGVQVSLVLVGRKLMEYFRKRPVAIRAAYPDVMSSFDFSAAMRVSKEASSLFESRTADEVWMIYTAYETSSRHVVTESKLLPIPPMVETSSQGGTTDYLYEPKAEKIMGELIANSLTIKIFQAMLETSTSEHAARMIAMDNATRNCKEIIDNLTMAYNKARQAAITMELIDIIGGVEALKS